MNLFQVYDDPLQMLNEDVEEGYHRHEINL